LERSKELVRKDIEDGYLSPEAAAAQYKYKPEA
jgi:N-methylhydantoinase B/oxoprolinase/acetone carboxylase alpha subunit